ncbi:hypothetical protein K432DRAFT_385619 [Lepidopterella palustris CBS 459.81]|uniref:RING-type domain-containing protein n=1 Tax=Lepidopterella palustris CBS 459.81 TaxID=1314670 RepID=A0A8E2E2K0_9PEZI|nr:hypothetical protein K432DRAFT_385619 [Lepidopterella palustris CBS 459.81]
MDLIFQGLAPGPRPTSEAAIESLPRQVVDQKWLDSHSGDECIICADSYGLGDILTDQRCGHFFHRKCLSSWLRWTCPLCNNNVLI